MASPPQRQPNLIILCTDEMRGDCLGANGMNGDIRTPHMDALAQRGVNFAKHFATCPKCVPARISLMTGRYCHTDGYRTIFQHLPADQPDLLSTLLRRNYQAALFGKNHCWENILDASHTPPQIAAGQQGLRIDHHSWTAQFRDIYERHQREQAPPPEARELCRLDRPLTQAVRYRGDINWHWPDEAYAEQAIRFLTQVRDRSRPFFLQVNIEAPHPPYAAPEPWCSMYDPQAITPYPHALPRGATLPLVKQREHRTGLEPDPHLLRRMQAMYYGMISRVDEQIGRILAAIDAQRLWQDTIVMLWSDHGDYAGQYGLPEKWDTVFADCLLHVPFVLCAPNLPQGRMIQALTDHTDIAPTLLALLDADPLPGMHGRSLLPVINGDRGRQAVFADGGHEDEMLQRVRQASTPHAAYDGKQATYRRAPDTMARAKMVRTNRHKMVMRLRGGHELYDLQDDPWELDNRWDDPSLTPVRDQLQQKLIEWCLATDTDRPYQPKVGA